MRLTTDYKMIPRDVSHEIPHMPTEEMIAGHEWFLYRVTPKAGLSVEISLQKPWWVFTGTRSECEDWMRRNAPEGIA